MALPITTVGLTSVLPSVVPVGPQEQDNAAILETTSDGLTATPSGTQSTSLLLISKINRVVTVGTAGDSVRLPPAIAGLTITVYNGHATKAVGVFPASAAQGGVTGGDAINAGGANAVYSLTAAQNATFRCVTSGQWYAAQAALS